VGYFDELARSNPEKILRICDWAKLPLEPRAVSLRRLKDLLRQCAEGLLTDDAGQARGSSGKEERTGV